MSIITKLPELQKAAREARIANEYIGEMAQALIAWGPECDIDTMMGQHFPGSTPDEIEQAVALAVQRLRRDATHQRAEADALQAHGRHQ